MTLQRIDEALANWNLRLEAMAANLLWLQGDSTYRLLTGCDGAARIALSGKTAARVQPALAAVSSVFQNFDLLNSTIGRVVEARKGFPTLFGGEQKLAEMEHLLFGNAIQLPVVDVPLKERTLLGQAQSRVCLSPEELLAPMPGIFAAARDAVLEVERAWEELAERMVRADQQAHTLRIEQERLGAGARVVPVLDRARRLLAQVREQLQADPLGALQTVKAEVQPALDDAARSIAEVVQARRDVERARVRCDELAQLRRDASEAAAEARAKIADCAALPAPLDDRRLEYLREWLERIERLSGNGGLQPNFAVEMRNWQASAEELVAQAKTVAAANRGAVAARRELRGRLDALKAKARARGVAESDGVASMAKEAERRLAERPTRLAEAAEAVAEYAKRLNGRSEPG